MKHSMIMHRDIENEPKLMVAASKMKPGDIVYNENNGHRLEVVDINKGSLGRVKIKFSDLDNNGKQITRLHDVRDMWELADDGDIAYEVNDEDFIVN